MIVCESLLCTDMWKQTLAKVLLQDFGVSPIENLKATEKALSEEYTI